jgi:hypothetical protein
MNPNPPFVLRPCLLTSLRNNRNWRWHKKLQIWLTKDDSMTPRALSPQHEEGYYIIWDTNNWTKVRVNFSLVVTPEWISLVLTHYSGS